MTGGCLWSAHATHRPSVRRAANRLFLAGIAAGAIACVRQRADRSHRVGSTQSTAIPSADSSLMQLSYPALLLGHDRVMLHDGDWEGDSSAVGRARASLSLSAHGELTTGEQGAAVVLLIDPGATGRFFDLVPVQATAGKLSAGRATALGDRVRPESLWVAKQRVFLRIVTHDFTDGLCCPTRRELQQFRLVGADSLALERRDLLERLPREPNTLDQ